MARFKIEEEEFEIPTMDSLTLAECETLYEMTRNGGGSGICQEDFEAASPDWDDDRRRAHVEANLARIKRPDFKIALAAIAYRRRHPEVVIEDAANQARTANGLEVTIALILGGDEEDPTSRSSSSSQTSPDSASSSSEHEKTADTGTDSAPSGTEPDTPRATTGTTG